jgi:hypothetical protein
VLYNGWKSPDRVREAERREAAEADVKTGVEEAPPRLDLERAVRRACDAQGRRDHMPSQLS